MQRDHPTPIELEEYLLDAMQPDDRARTETHLAGCTRCQQALAALRAHHEHYRATHDPAREVEHAVQVAAEAPTAAGITAAPRKSRCPTRRQRGSARRRP